MSLGSSLSADTRTLLLQHAGARKLWQVGGAVRDELLGRRVRDVDFVVAGEARSLARGLAPALGGHYFDLDVERDTGRIVRPARAGGLATLDFARLRGAGILQDLAERDFTINALAFSLETLDELIDPGSGLQDLKDRRLRACSPRAMLDDPVRCLRGVRLALELELRMEPATKEQIRQAGSALSGVAAERVRDELMRMLQPAWAGRSARLLSQLGLLWQVCPDLAPLQAEPADRWGRTLATLDRLGELLEVLLGGVPSQLSENLIVAEASLRLGRYRDRLEQEVQATLSGGRRGGQILCLAGLYHAATWELDPDESVSDSPDAEDAGIMHAASRAALRARQLRLSAAESRLAAAIVAAHRIPFRYPTQDTLTPLEIHRYFRASQAAGVPAVLLHLASFLGHGARRIEDWRRRLQVARTLLEARFERFDELVSPQPLVNGSELIEALGIEAGPAVGEMLIQLTEAQIEGRVRDRAQALAFARNSLAAAAPAGHAIDK